MSKQRFYHSGVSDDLNILIKVMKPERGKSFLTFSAYGAGEAAICLGTMGVDEVVAFDLEYAEGLRYMIEIKGSIVKLFNRSETLIILGLQPANQKRRKFLTEKLLNSLPPQQKIFWIPRRSWLENGLFHSDKISQFFYLFKKLLWLLSPNEAYHEIIHSPDRKIRAQLFESYITRPWLKGLLSIIGKRVNLFFPKTLWNASDFPKKANQDSMSYCEQLVKSGLAHNPLFAHYVRNRFEKLPEHLLPPHLQTNNFPMIRKNLDCIKVKLTKPGVPNLLQFETSNTFNGAYISNIIDYLKSNQRNIFFKKLRASLKDGAPILVYSNESYSKVPLETGFVYNEQLSKTIKQMDRACVYTLLEVYVAV